jgi:hypothetical protein
VSTSFNLSVLGQLDTGIEDGGRFRWSGADASASISRQFTPALSAGISARYAKERPD